MTELFRTEAFFSNRDFTKFSLIRFSNQYKTFSEIITEKYPGYALDERYRIAPTTITPTVNLVTLLQIMKSHDFQLIDQYKSMLKDPKSHFLDGTILDKDKICIASYHRSGNTFMRRYIEAITSVATGSDNSLNTMFSLAV